MSATAPSSLIRLAETVQGDGGAALKPGDELELIRSADKLTKLSEARVTELVVEARARGVSWQAIGDALGVTRQAAFKRFTNAIAHSPQAPSMVAPTINLVERTVDVFESLDANDYDAVKELMTYACARALSRRRLMGVWREVTSATGQLCECSNTTVQTAGGRTTLEKMANRRLASGAVVQTTLNHEAGEWLGRVAFNGAGKITGILIAPPNAKNLPF